MNCKSDKVSSENDTSHGAFMQSALEQLTADVQSRALRKQ